MIVEPFYSHNFEKFADKIMRFNLFSEKTLKIKHKASTKNDKKKYCINFTYIHLKKY